jgi:NitT/TauT family transport system substrate-binding protein
MLKHRLFYIFLGVAMAMAGCGGNGAPSGVTTSGLKTVYQVSTADDPNRRIMYFSITHGYVQSPTVDLQFQYLPFATAATTFQSKQYPLVEANWLNVAQAYQGGQLTQIVSPGIANVAQTILALPKNSTITDASQLKGKKVGIISLGTIYALEGRYVLNRKYNLNPALQGGDIKWQEINAGDALLGLLKSGDIDAALVTQIQSYTVQQNPSDYKVLENVTKAYLQLTNTKYVMNSALVIYKNPDSMPAKDAKEVQRMLAANYEYYKAQKDAIVTEVAKETKVDVNYLKWATTYFDFPTGAVSADAKSVIQAGWQAAITIKSITSAPPIEQCIFSG